MTDTLGQALPREMSRVRDEILPLYDGLPNGAGAFGAMMIRATLDRAQRVIMEGDVIAMIAVYKELKEIEP